MKIHSLKISYVLFCLTCLSACQSAEQKNPDGANTINTDVVNNPATASSNKNAENIPVFEFKEQTHDFGTIMQGEKTSYAFRFRNSGKSNLVIQSANGSCGCTIPEYPKEQIAPGKEGVINVTFNSEGKEGKQNKTVTIIANTIPNSTVLTITGEVKIKN